MLVLLSVGRESLLAGLGVARSGTECDHVAASSSRPVAAVPVGAVARRGESNPDAMSANLPEGALNQLLLAGQSVATGREERSGPRRDVTSVVSG
jgi:hypothetical protein